MGHQKRNKEGEDHADQYDLKNNCMKSKIVLSMYILYAYLYKHWNFYIKLDIAHDQK